jgi:hypothetical protein
MGKGPRSKAQPRQARPLVERLEDRIVPSFPATTNGIHIIEDQLPGSMSSAMTRFVATHTDGTQKELLSQTNQFRAVNPNYTVLHYQLGTGNSPYDYIINDQWSSDFSYVNQQESWFAHQSFSGEPQSAADLASGRVGNSTGWDQADIANPAWQQYTLNQVFQNMAATGSDAWFADSFTYGIGGAGYNSPIPTRYQGTNAANPAYWPGGVTWTTQLGNWAQTVENAFAQHNAANGTDYKFIPNLDARVTSWEPNWYANASGAPFIDGAFLEGFGEYTDTFDWTLSMNRGLNLTDNGKIVILQPYPSAAPGTAAGQQQIDFFLGTYLLLKGDQTYLNIDYGGGVQYYPEYQLDLGAPTTPLASNVSSYLWNGVYRRDFQNGFVLVNPGTTTNTLNLGGNYRQVLASGGGTMTDAQIDANGNYTGGSLTYQNVNSVTLAGGSAAIFLNPPGGSASFLKADAGTQGYWQGAYGGDGYNVVGAGPPSYPSYAAVTPAGNSEYTWAASTPDPRALQKPANPADHVAAAWYSAGTFTVDINLTGGTHQVALYLLDWDNNGRSERIDVLDGTTGDVLGSRTVNGFVGGEYLVWSVGGHVTFRLTNLAGNNAVLGGLFFGPAGSAPSGGGSASFVKSDGTTQGSWQGAYGGDGYNVIDAGSPSYPAYATVTPVGNSAYTWVASTPDPRALEKPANPADRIAAAWYSAGVFSIDVNLTDGATHQVALYLLDWDGIGRSEQVDVLDGTTGQVLDTRTVNGFSGGEYLVWTLGGHVLVRLTNHAGNNAVLSGLFFGPGGAPPSDRGSAAFVKTDAGTQGYWQGAYGGDGYNVVDAGPPAYPSYATVTPAGNSTYVWAASTLDPRGLQKPAAPADHVAAAWYAGGSFTVDVSITDGATHQVALYLLDWDNNGRSEQIDVLDAASGAVLGSRTVNGFVGGDYLVWTLGGHVTIRLTDLAGNNAVLSGLFFGPAGAPPPAGGSAQFVNTDTGTQGSWQGHYGGAGYNVVAAGSASYPSYAAVTPVGNSAYTWAASTPDPRGLQKPADAGDHVAAAWYSTGSFTVDVNLTDGATHRVALYLLDWDGIGRSEQVDVLDAVTGQVLDTRAVDTFSGGEYLAWDVSGDVAFRLTRKAGNNAVLSGLFFDPAAPA